MLRLIALLMCIIFFTGFNWGFLKPGPRRTVKKKISESDSRRPSNESSSNTMAADLPSDGNNSVSMAGASRNE